MNMTKFRLKITHKVSVTSLLGTTRSKRMLKQGNLSQTERGQWTVYYTSPKSFKISLSYFLA